MIRAIDADSLLDDMQELLNQEVLGNTVSDVGAGIEIAMNRIKRAKETTLNTLRDAIYEDAVAHGLWEKTDNTVQSIIEYYQELERDNLLCVPYDQDEVMRVQAAKIIGEEQAELELSSDDEEAYVDELADVIIASLSVAGKLGIDIDAAVRRKMEINKGRPWKHGKAELKNFIKKVEEKS